MDTSTEAASTPDKHKPRRPRREPSSHTGDFITVKRQLGKGHNATVYLIQYNSDPTPRAMKKILRNNRRTQNMNRLRANNPGRAPLPRTADTSALVDRFGTEEAKIRREIAIMKKCDHPNIIKFYSYIDDQTSASICLIMEYMEGGELQWQSHDNPGEPYLSMNQTQRCMRDVVLGLEYLHGQGIVHRDIKPSNIMWTADRSQVKIGDFGVAHLTKPDDDFVDLEGPRHAGTPSFLAPEIAPGGELPMPDVTPAVDLWSLGVTLYCMLFASLPFAPAEAATNAGPVAAEASLYRAIREDAWLPKNTMCANRAPVKPRDREKGGVLHLLGKLLEKDPARRYGIAQVKASIDVLHWPSSSSPPRAPSPLGPPSPTLTAHQDNAVWLLQGVQRRQEWITGTTPRIVVSEADEANAILEPRFKWNTIRKQFGIGRRLGNIFRPRPTQHIMASEPVDQLTRKDNDERWKGKGKAKDKSRSVDVGRGLGRRGSGSGSGSVSALALTPLSASPGSASDSSPPARRGAARIFHWPGRTASPASSKRRVTLLPAAGRHSVEALGSAPMVPLQGGLLGTDQRTSSMTNARDGVSGGLDADWDGVEGAAVGMIAVPRAAVVRQEESEASGSSYGSGGRVVVEDERDVYDDEECGEEEEDEDDDDGPRGDVYSDDDDDEESAPITIRTSRSPQRATRFIHGPPPESDSEEEGPPPHGQNHGL
ncbi:kinase-like domain-containing protein [Roridomyces roridus]|uniref:Kinase-like domain-containing protein n=1 Tax=Roridomyces roridus TaxID=1738132 RepID=A0AAD7B8P6_9AGAR|nr:kinase-like domain-containing protein [Roridomyces roridus]